MQSVQGPSKSTPNKGTTIVLEILPALFGIYGIGWIYSGQLSTGIILLIIGLLVIWGGYAVIFLGATVLSAVTMGLGVFAYCIACLVPLLQLAGAAASAIALDNRLDKLT